MKSKIRIGILGIGGVGGYFGGRLAQKYAGSDSVEIVFIAKKTSVEILRMQGLRLITSDSEEVIRPSQVFSDSDEIGLLDYLICAVKSYDLIESLSALDKSIINKTVILPLLNGINAKERILKIYPNAQVVDGCVYIVAKLVAPATVQVTGSMHNLYFGSENGSGYRLNEFAGLLKADGIDSHFSSNIKQLIWEKYIFVSSLATLTSYLNLPVGAILENETHLATLRQLVSEVARIAEVEGITLPNIIEITLTKIRALPRSATSSMHNDFIKGGKTEFEALTEFVVIAGLRLGVPTPAFNLIISTYSQWRLRYYMI